MENTSNIIFITLKLIPLIILVLGGIGFSIYRYKDYPKTSLLTIASLLLIAGLTIFNTIIYPLVIPMLVSSNMDSASMSYLFGAIGLTTSFMDFIALGLLFFAVWSNRNPS